MEVRQRLVEVAARLLAEEGLPAVSARRVAREASTSTMAVYTHFGSMDELVAAVCREGFRRFGLELERPTATADPVADFMTQGWGYRRFALSDRDLYRVMFQLRTAPASTEADVDASIATFLSLLARVERCRDEGRWQVDDVWAAGEVVWSTVHGHSMIELSGYHDDNERDPVATFGECLLRLSLAFGDDPELARASLAASRRRARRADHTT